MQINKVKVICIGSALVDTIASSPRQIDWGDDVPGFITSNVGGVAFNICQQLALSQLKEVELLTALGKDSKGRKIIKLCDELGIITKNVYKSNIVNKHVGCIICGGNNDNDRMPEIRKRANEWKINN